MKKIFILFSVIFTLSFSGNCFSKEFNVEDSSPTPTKTEQVPAFRTIKISTPAGLDGSTFESEVQERRSDGQLFFPVLNGGILPGPKYVLTGKDYFIKNLLPGITNKFLIALLAVCVVTFVVGGILYLTAQGDTDQTKKAFETIFWSIGGLIIAILSFAAVKFLVGINFTP